VRRSWSASMTSPMRVRPAAASERHKS
jgi:hypothetical protein